MSVNMNQEALNAEFRINHGDIAYAPLKMGSQIVRRSKRVFKGVFDVAVQGSGGSVATGSYGLYDPVFGKAVGLALPASFIITNVLLDCVTAFVGTGASVALSSGLNAGDLFATTAITSAPFVAGTIIAGIPVSAATAIKVPATQAQPGTQPVIVVSGAALTVGQLNVHIEGFLSDLL